MLVLLNPPGMNRTPAAFPTCEQRSRAISRSPVG
jgi:hypothetical protein